MSEVDGDDSPTITKRRGQGWFRPSFIIPIITLNVIIGLVVLPAQLNYAATEKPRNFAESVKDSELTCMDGGGCKINIVESIPIGLVYPNDSVLHPSIYQSWMQLISLAQSSIEIASPHIALRREDNCHCDSAKQGEDVFEALLEAGRDRGVRLRLLATVPPPGNLRSFKRTVDLEYLSKQANAEVRSLNFPKILGYGYMHTKLFLVDRTHFYIGSAGAYWRSMSQFRDVGLLAVNCSCLASDIAKIFDMYWKLFEDGEVPAAWPEAFETKMNIDNPMNLTLDENKHRVYFASSPPALLPKGRTNDLDAILDCINRADKFISIDVTKYRPLRMRTAKLKYWPIIDDALRSAAIERGVHIRILISWWECSKPRWDYFLNSLIALTKSYENVNIEVKLFIVPKNNESYKIEYTGLSHNKYLVTDKAAYTGTNNLCGDYFLESTGISMVFENVGQNKNTGSIIQQIEDVFNRNWMSEYAHPLNTTNSERLAFKYAGFAIPDV